MKKAKAEFVETKKPPMSTGKQSLIVVACAFLSIAIGFTAGWTLNTPTTVNPMQGKVWIEFRDVQHALDSAAMLQARTGDGRVTVCLGKSKEGHPWKNDNAYVYKRVNLIGAVNGCWPAWGTPEWSAKGLSLGGENEVGHTYIHHNYLDVWPRE